VSQASVTRDTIVVSSVPTERMSRCAYTARAPLAHEGETLSTPISAECCVEAQQLPPHHTSRARLASPFREGQCHPTAP